MAGVVIRKFVTDWEAWAKRWTDPRMVPWHSPWFVADCGVDGFLTGPYVSPRGEIRDEVVHYETWDDAAEELKLRRHDFQPASTWAKDRLAPLGAVQSEIVSSLEGAKKHLLAQPRREDLYRGAMVGITQGLLLAYQAARGGAKAQLPPLAEEILAERDRKVEESALDVLAKKGDGKVGLH